MWVVLEDDLVDSCKAGDDVTICGVVMRRWKPVFADVSTDEAVGIDTILNQSRQTELHMEATFQSASICM